MLSSIFALAFLACGIFIIYRYSFFMIKGYQSYNWSKTTGRIIQSKKQKNADPEAGGYEYSINYSFVINDKTYKSDRIFYGTFDFDLIDYQKRYYINQEVNVYYNPLKPEESVLENGIVHNMHFLLVISIVFVSIGLIIIL
ncbi:MAG: DUF3592 domain-containing protein [Cytophagaceae bacterium]